MPTVERGGATHRGICRFTDCCRHVERQTMRNLIISSLAGFLALGMSGLALATEPNTNDVDYPKRPISVLVPYAPGGSTDVVTRMVTEQMSIVLHQKVLVQNVVGSGGTTAVLRAKRALPDGYTLLTGNMGTLAAALALHPQLEYDPRTSFQPIGILAQAPILILGRRDFPPKDLNEFILYVKANAYKLDEGHAGFGSFPYVSAARSHSRRAAVPRIIRRRRPCHDGARRRPTRLHVQPDNGFRPLGARRQGQGLRHSRTAAQPGPSGSPHHGRSRIAGVRGIQLARAVRAERGSRCNRPQA